MHLLHFQPLFLGPDFSDPWKISYKAPPCSTPCRFPDQISSITDIQKGLCIWHGELTQIRIQLILTFLWGDRGLRETEERQMGGSWGWGQAEDWQTRGTEDQWVEGWGQAED